jgi:hypothetical protein
MFEFKSKKEMQINTPATFSLYCEGELGLYYLPLQMTTKGSQRAEGYADGSTLIPISDFGVVPGLTLDPTSHVN